MQTTKVKVLEAEAATGRIGIEVLEQESSALTSLKVRSATSLCTLRDPSQPAGNGRDAGAEERRAHLHPVVFDPLYPTDYGRVLGQKSGAHRPQRCADCFGPGPRIDNGLPELQQTYWSAGICTAVCV